ncbi:MAG: MFS transporter [Alphaproteobacteria bacterium]|nr:MFS transporter [Alphaproteobacteria bacterium]
MSSEADRPRGIWRQRNVVVLAIAQALMTIGQTTMIAEAALVGQTLAENKSLATLPVGIMQLATMLTTFPASFFMKRFGRRLGFSVGTVFGAVGQAICAAGVFAGSFELFCLGCVVNGVYNGFALFYRFAAADGLPESSRSRAISLVIAGGVLAAIIGPELARMTHDIFAPVAFAGSFVAVSFVGVVALAVVQFVDIPVPGSAERAAVGRPLPVILAQPKAAVAVFSGVVAYGTMSLLMNATPLAMVACGFTFDDAARTIQGHALAMFAPSFFTGALIARFGLLNMMMAGAALLGVCALIALSGIEFWHFYIGLVVLGLGWNFLYVGATSLLTQTYVPAEKAKVQAANDFLVFGTVSAAAVASGWLQHSVGWSAMNAGALPVVAASLLALCWLWAISRGKAA